VNNPVLTSKGRVRDHLNKVLLSNSLFSKFCGLLILPYSFLE
jgi:hypothetical protein